MNGSPTEETKKSLKPVGAITRNVTIPRRCSYKLTISQRSSIPPPTPTLSPSPFSTIRFLLFVRLPYLRAFTRAFISAGIYHRAPFSFRPSSSRVRRIHHEVEKVHLGFGYGGGLLPQELQRETSTKHKFSKRRVMKTCAKTVHTNPGCIFFLGGGMDGL